MFCFVFSKFCFFFPHLHLIWTSYDQRWRLFDSMQNMMAGMFVAATWAKVQARKSHYTTYITWSARFPGVIFTYVQIRVIRVSPCHNNDRRPTRIRCHMFTCQFLFSHSNISIASILICLRLSWPRLVTICVTLCGQLSGQLLVCHHVHEEVVSKEAWNKSEVGGQRSQLDTQIHKWMFAHTSMRQVSYSL